MGLLEGSSLLVTGGTGSFGKSFIRRVLDDANPRRVVIYSRDELKQWEARQQFGDDPRLRWFIGDIPDLPRLKRAMHGIDHVVHAAAQKQVHTGEYHPFEFVKTTILGSQNVIEAAIDNGVKRVVALSTDTASSPINLYGATKLSADKLFLLGNHDAVAYPTRFAVVRYGNVTDLRRTRFLTTLPDAVQMVLDTFDLMQGGELVVPHIPSHPVTDLAQAIAPGAGTHDIGLRPGEKLHEEMISPEEGRRAITVMGGRHYIEPEVETWGYVKRSAGEPTSEGFHGASDKNDLRSSAQGIRALVESGVR